MGCRWLMEAGSQEKGSEGSRVALEVAGCGPSWSVASAWSARSSGNELHRRVGDTLRQRGCLCNPESVSFGLGADFREGLSPGREVAAILLKAIL